MEPLRVSLGPRSYDIRFGSVFHIASFVSAKQALVAYDERVSELARIIHESFSVSGTQISTIAIPSGEASKSPVQLGRLYDALATIPADRATLLVAVGGGVTGDVAGFAAATFNRGIPCLMVPTTLLAMVDSSVGGKTGINHPRGKNLIGSFHQPAGVFIDLQALDTLPEREYRSGLAEVVKYGVILDAVFFGWLEENAVKILARDSATLRTMVSHCCRLKAGVVEKDEREQTGLRAVLNYGHTFAHAFETLGNYSHWLHGEAVSAGMACAARLAMKLHRIGAELETRQGALLEQFGLPLSIPEAWPVETLLDVMRRDKKAVAGRLRFVLPARLGHVELVDGIDEQLVCEVLGES